jgi:hypothetical protein
MLTPVRDHHGMKMAGFAKGIAVEIPSFVYSVSGGLSAQFAFAKQPALSADILDDIWHLAISGRDVAVFRYRRGNF